MAMSSAASPTDGTGAVSAVAATVTSAPRTTRALRGEVVTSTKATAVAAKTPHALRRLPRPAPVANTPSCRTRALPHPGGSPRACAPRPEHTTPDRTAEKAPATAGGATTHHRLPSRV